MKMQLGNGRFEILKPLVRGEGGFALLYEAYDTALSINVAVKILKEQHRTNQDTLERFKNEAQIIAHLVHPNIVRIYDLNLTEFYYAMSLLPEPLVERIEAFHGILPLGQIIRMAIDITKALIELERAEIVHRDIKSANILFDKQGCAVLTDFGIAIRSNQVSKMIIGTPEYMSPEQFRGDSLDTRSDLYSFGVLLYELATGKVPFFGDTYEIIENQHLNIHPIEPRKLVKVIDVQLENIILRLLQKNREHRYLSAASLLDELNEVKGRYRKKVLENVNIYKSNERFDLATIELKNYLAEVDPEDDVINRELRLINFKFFVQDAQFNLNRGYFEQAKERIEQAKKIIISDTVLKEQFSLAQMNIIKAEQYHHDFVNNLKGKEFEKSRKNLGNLHELAPASEVIRQAFNLIDLLEQGVQNFERGKYSTALKNFESAKSLDEIGLEFIKEYVDLIDEKLQVEEKHFNEHIKIIKNHENLSEIHHYRDELLELKSDDAWFDKENAGKMRDLYSEIHVKLSDYFKSQDNFSKAQNHLNIALNYKPNEIFIKKKLLEMTAAGYEEAENYNLAKEVYQSLTDEIDKSYFEKVTEMTVKNRIQKQFYSFEAYFHRDNREEAKNALVMVEKELEYQKTTQSQYDYSTFYARLKEYKLLVDLKNVENSDPNTAMCEINKILDLTQEHKRSNKDFVVKETAVIKKNISENKSDEIITAEFSKKKTTTGPLPKPNGLKKKIPFFYLLIPVLLFGLFLLIRFFLYGESPKIKKSLLSVISIPENSQLFINDSLYQYTNGVFKDSFQVGHYIVEIKNRNYLRFTKEVFLRDKIPSEINAAMKRILPQTEGRVVKNGILHLVIHPVPDLIFINGKNYDNLNNVFRKKLPPGSYALSIRKQGYSSLDTIVVVKQGEITSKEIKLNMLASGSLEMVIEPYATIIIDGDTLAVKKSNLSLPSLPSGSHDLVLIHPDIYGTFSEKILIDPGKRLKINRNLEDECGVLILRIETKESGKLRPIWAHILINNKEINGPKDYLKTLIFEGRYVLAVRRQGYRTLTPRKNFTIHKGQTREYTIELLK